MAKPIRVLLYYKYLPIENAEQFAADHLAFCKSIGLKGRILVADEGINGTVSLTINFNNTIDQVEVDGVSANSRVSGSSATITFNASEASSCTIGVHVNNGSNIDALAVTGYDYSVN